MKFHLLVPMIEKEVIDKVDISDNLETVFMASCAISLKRIADKLDGKGLEEVLDKVASHPMNGYGEGFSEAIQNAIERGQRGINTND